MTESGLLKLLQPGGRAPSAAPLMYHRCAEYAPAFHANPTRGLSRRLAQDQPLLPGQCGVLGGEARHPFDVSRARQTNANRLRPAIRLCGAA